MSKPVLFLSATPQMLIPRSIDLNSAEIERLILHPPNNRQAGWNMDFPRRTIEHGANSIIRGDQDYGALTLMSNGYMELVISAVAAFCWPQEEEEIRKCPRFNPYAVCEFPVTFLRLYRTIVDKTNLPGPFVFNLAYKNIKGIVLWPGHPMSIAYGSPMTEARPFPSNELILEGFPIEKTFEPDKIAYQVIAEVYRAFGYKSETVPFYDDANEEFTF